MLSQTFLATFALASLSSAHFILHWPPTAGFSDDTEPNGPCGGVPVTVNSSSPNVPVDRFAVMIENVHPAGQWQFRATLDTHAPYNFTDIVPIVNTAGIGDFCLSYMHAPSEFAGKPGVIQVMDNSVDGILYQCAPVNFVTGSNSTLGGACTNVSDFSATWTTMESFNGSATSPSSASGSMTTGTPSSTGTGSAAAGSSASKAAAATMAVGGIVGGLGLLAGVLAL